MSRKVDRRVLKTQKAIRQAVMELIQEKGVSEITVSNITSRADINRGTFYLHYLDVQDLMEQYQTDILSSIKTLAQQVDLFQFARYKEQPYPILVAILKQIAKHADLLQALFGPKGDPAFTLKFKSFIKEQILHKLRSVSAEQDMFTVDLEYVAVFISSAHLGIVQHWLETGMEKSPEEVASLMTSIAINGPLSTVLGRQR